MPEKQLSFGMRIVSALGGPALCAAVFLFFYFHYTVTPAYGSRFEPWVVKVE